MIIGIGSDIVDIRRIERMVVRFGQRALDRIFTPTEQAYALSIPTPRARMGALAKRFAAKEACMKALGTGFAQGIGWQDVEVVNNDAGRPSINLKGGAAAYLKTLIPHGREARIYLSLSDEYPFAQAFVVVESTTA
ncbi:MAG: holo-ACP synthase [Alphaproteobacteria bacterium]|nr:holo-ACP synthase [Alphaproteobacteria bacterium]